MRSNCVLWALKQQWKHGGWVRFQRSPDFRWLPRFEWSQDGTRWYRWVHLEPPSSPLGALWFKGKPTRTFTCG